MIELLLFIVIGFSMGLAHHTSADVKWDDAKTRPFYARASLERAHYLKTHNAVQGPDYDILLPPGYDHYPPHPDVPGGPLQDGDSVLIRQPDGTYKLCTKHGLAMVCTDM